MHEPLSNIGFVSPRKNRPDPELAGRPPSWFVGKEAKISFPATLDPGVTQEWMWVKVERADRRYCYGKLDNDPIATDRIKCGDPVRFTPRQVAAVE